MAGAVLAYSCMTKHSVEGSSAVQNIAPDHSVVKVVCDINLKALVQFNIGLQ